jgi:hypothetical protein
MKPRVKVRGSPRVKARGSPRIKARGSSGVKARRSWESHHILSGVLKSVRE